MTARSNNSVSSSLASNDSLMSSNKVPQAKSPYNSVTHSVRRIIPESKSRRCFVIMK